MPRTKPGKPRFLQADRRQLRLLPLDLEQVVATNDPVRAVWAFVEALDLMAFYDEINAVEGAPGRSAIDPKILLALWLQATLDGIGSARELARVAKSDLRYQWIRGGVDVEYHRLSDFRSSAADKLDGLLIDSVARLMKTGLVKLERVAQDGMRVRANAGASSMRSGSRLKELQSIAREQIDRLKEELDSDTGASGRRREASRRRAAEERERLIAEALAELPEVEERKESDNGKRKSEPRVSTTDPHARVMKMPDGGFRPALNVHLVTDTATKLIAVADVNNHGTDQRMTPPLADRLHELYGIRPAEWLEDGGCVTLDAVNHLGAHGTAVIAPVRAPRNDQQDRYAPRPNDSTPVAEWRIRMATEYAQATYRLRGATAELVNAQFRGQGLGQFLVRSIQKARSVVLLHALTHNMRRTWALA